MVIAMTILCYYLFLWKARNIPDMHRKEYHNLLERAHKEETLVGITPSKNTHSEVHARVVVTRGSCGRQMWVRANLSNNL